MVTRSDCVGSGSMLKVQLDSGDIRRCHGDQLRHISHIPSSEVFEETGRDDNELLMHPGTKFPDFSNDNSTATYPPVSTQTSMSFRSYLTRNRFPPVRCSPTWTHK